MSEDKKPKRRNKYLSRVHAIQTASITVSLENCVIKDLGYQQALSILLRHEQLAREGKLHPSQISPEKKAMQTNKCYEQRSRQKK